MLRKHLFQHWVMFDVIYVYTSPEYTSEALTAWSVKWADIW